MGKKHDPFSDLLSSLGELAHSGGGKIDCISTGVPALDWLISEKVNGGGIPRGWITEFYGDPSTGKSLIIYNILSQIQQAGGVAILDDTEHSFNPAWASKCGLDVDQLIVLNSLTVKEHYDSVEKIFDTFTDKDGNIIPDKVPLLGIGLDSVAMLSTEHEQDVGLNKTDLTKAKNIRGLVRLLVKKVSDFQAIYMVSNHVIASLNMYGPKKVTPGGSGIPFGASVRIELRLKEKLKDGDDIFAVRSEFSCPKNRLARPFRNIRLTVSLDHGLLQDSGLFELCVKTGIIVSPTKGWYTFSGSKEKFREANTPLDTMLEWLQKSSFDVKVVPDE